MFSAKWKLGTVDFADIEAIKREVFIDEMGLSEDEVFDNRDCISAHLIVTDEESQEAIATARIYPLGHNTHIGEIAVRAKFRDQAYADLALRMLLYKAQQLSGALILADVFEAEMPLYESFGFERTSAIVNGKAAMRVVTTDVKWHSDCHDNH